jgi:hypothetical protein
VFDWVVVSTNWFLVKSALNCGISQSRIIYHTIGMRKHDTLDIFCRIR